MIAKGGSTHLEFARIKRIAIIMAQIETDKKVLSFHRLRYKQMLMLEKAGSITEPAFFDIHGYMLSLFYENGLFRKEGKTVHRFQRLKVHRR